MAYAESPKGLSKWEQFLRTIKGFGTFMYDKEKGEVMGRNGKSWAKITLFFVVFYLCLSAFFAGMLNAFLATMPALSDGPKLTQYLAGKSALRTVPSHKISKFDKDKLSTYKNNVVDINKLLKTYKDQSTPAYASEYCNFTSTDPRSASQEKQCRYDLTKLGPCYSAANDFTYGFKDGLPCFFMRMNKVFNWIPDPDDGLSYLRVECEGKAKVYPEETPGFPVSFFPFRGESNWLAPVVAIQVNFTQEEKTEVKCSAYGKNVEQSTTYLLERGAFNRIRITIS